MITLLRHPVFARLFAAQVLSLMGTGLMTVALALLAYELAGARAGVVLGIALTIKMVAYVGIAPVLAGVADRWDRKRLLVALDMFRAAVALTLPFVSEIWQVYALIFLLQCASAMFSPAFQALIPEVLEGEARYTKALSLSRVAYDLESLASPALAAALLLLIPFSGLFAGTSAGFVLSALLVLSTRFPLQPPRHAAPFGERVTRGLRLYLATPRLRGLLSVTLAAAAASAFVIVNTVVVAREYLGRGEASVALLLGAYGAGSMLAAFALPGALRRWQDRGVMIVAAASLASLLAIAASIAARDSLGWGVALALWAALGAAYAAALTPAGRLLTRSAAKPDRVAVFAAQFALSHGCWLLAYPLMGWLGASSLAVAFAAASGLSALGVVLALRVWPAADPAGVVHSHPDLPAGHPHLAEGTPAGPDAHAHAVVVDEMHPNWPIRG